MTRILTELEQQGRERLRQLKPKVYDKIITHDYKIARGESVAIVGLQYSYLCNFKCKHYSIETLKDPTRPTMTIPDVKNFADQLDAMGIASICITGGEPIIFPEIEQIIDALGRDRFNIAMDTNGLKMTEEKLKWIISKGIDRIQLSIDGQPDSHNTLRGERASFNSCIRTLEAAVKLGFKVVVNVVATKTLIHSGELLRHMDFLSQYGQHINLLPAKYSGAFMDSLDEIPNQADNDFLNTLPLKYNCSTHQTTNVGHNFGCYAVKRMFNITPYGDIIPCCFIPISLGNAFEEPIRDIIERGLNIKWFGYKTCASTCLAGNTDNEFFKKILPQTRGRKQPVSYKDIIW